MVYLAQYFFTSLFMLPVIGRVVFPARLSGKHLAFVTAALILVAFAYLGLWNDNENWHAPGIPEGWHAPEIPQLHAPPPADTNRFWDPSKTTEGYDHPIRKLMLDARTHQDEALLRRSTTLEAAAAKYRERRGRHPPPGFDVWFKAAMEDKAIIVEEYFDRIYKDLTPFWAIDPETLKRRASAWEWNVKVRDGKTTEIGPDSPPPWVPLWAGLVREFETHLPDVDMPINRMDESRLLVPFETVAKMVQQEAAERKMPKPEEVTTMFRGLKSVDAANVTIYEPHWYGDGPKFWNMVAKTCGPDSPAHGVVQLDDDAFRAPAQFPQNYRPSYAYKGYIQNFTAASDPCLQPHIRQLHGSLIEGISTKSSDELIPLFGGSKLPMNNEILIPGAMYLTGNEFYSGGADHGPPWAQKKNGVIWRGDGSGGRTKDFNWHHFQRHRLVDMLNHTTVTHVEINGTRALTFELPDRDIYPDMRIKPGNLGIWLKSFADVAFVHLCCDYFSPFFRPTAPVSIPMKEQYNYKILPDVDGNSFSARFRGFLQSTSLPLKATAYAEWHDDRLVPWLHFVPLDNTLQDLYPVLDYFGDEDGPGDAAAEWIATQGKEWAETVLRREDMKLYVWRLLLEWARVCDENRQNLGFVGDLKR